MIRDVASVRLRTGFDRVTFRLRPDARATRGVTNSRRGIPARFHCRGDLNRLLSTPCGRERDHRHAATPGRGPNRWYGRFPCWRQRLWPRHREPGVGLIDTPGNQSPGRTQRSRRADIRPVGVKSSDPLVQVRDRSIVEAGSCSIVLRRYDRAGDRRTEDTGEPEKNGVYAAHRPVAPSR